MKVRPDPADLARLKVLFRALAPASRGLGLRVMVVGGAVRDLAGGRSPVGEWDVVVLEPSHGGGRGLAEHLARRWGWREPVSFPRFGTYLVEGPAGQVEVAEAGLRTALDLPEGDPLRRDAQARDFTLNALYLDPLSPPAGGRVEVLDPSGQGLADLACGLLRTPLPATRTLSDDPLRILRAARFAAARLYRVQPSLARAARAVAPMLRKVAAERVREEMDRLLTGSSPSRGLTHLARWGALDVLLPEVGRIVGYSQDNPHHWDNLFVHTLKVVDGVPPDHVSRWAALLHDCGKPYCRVGTDEGCRYFGHERKGSALAIPLMRRLRFSRKRTREVSELVRLHMVFYREEWTDRAVRRLITRAGDLLPRLLDLVEADSRALRRRAPKIRAVQDLRRRVALLQATTPPAKSPLGGRRIMRLLGIGPGVEVGRAKAALAAAVAEGRIPPEEKAAASYLLRWRRGRAGRRP